MKFLIRKFKILLILIVVLIIALSFGCSDRSTEFPINNSDLYVDKSEFYCGTDGDDDIYALNETYFNEDQTINMKLKVIYFTNGNESPLSEKAIQDRIAISNVYYKEAKIQFKYNGTEYITGNPEDNPKAIESIKAMELMSKERRQDLRRNYYIEHFDFWHIVFGQDNTMIAYIYDNLPSGYAGVAGGIGATYFAIRTQYMAPIFHTWEHELGHDLGLYHTHQADPSNGLNSDSGDMVCDTYKSVDTLFSFVTDNCKATDNCPIPTPYIEDLIINIMSYTDYVCRAEFTSEQNKRKRKIIETTTDLRNCIDGFKTLTRKKWTDLEIVEQEE